jgi:caa(3)-type oxidase subunit IV
LQLRLRGELVKAAGSLLGMRFLEPMRFFPATFYAAVAAVSDRRSWPFNLVVALAIAIAKAIVIALFFMHIKGSSRLLHLAAVTGVIWLLFLIWLTLGDYSTAAGCRWAIKFTWMLLAVVSRT